MAAAQQQGIGQARLAALHPVPDMMCVDESCICAAGEAAAAVTNGERATQGRGN